MLRKCVMLLCCIIFLVFMTIGCMRHVPLSDSHMLPAEDLQSSATPSMKAKSTETPPTKPAMVKTWRQLYKDFLLSFETFYDIERDWIVPSSFGLLPAFTLIDIDNNGIPELIIMHGNGEWSDDYGTWEDIHCYALTFADDSLIVLGELKYDLFGEFGKPQNLAEGLFSDVSYKGHYGSTYYYTIDNDELVERLIHEYHNGSDSDYDPYSTIYIYDDNGNMTTVSVFDLEYEGGYIEYDEAYATLDFIALDFYKITDAVINDLILNSVYQ